MSFLFVGVGGFIGSILRFYLSFKMNNKLFATWTANITGSVLLALSYHFYLTDSISHSMWLFLGVGFCGAYTTFSTFGNEALQLFIEKKNWFAILYIISSLGLSLIAVTIILHIF